jgi:uncharacterized membrane protein
VLVGVRRLYEQSFDSAEVALVEAVTKSVGHALERLWNRDDLLRAQAKVIDALLPAQLAVSRATASECADGRPRTGTARGLGAPSLDERRAIRNRESRGVLR